MRISTLGLAAALAAIASPVSAQESIDFSIGDQAFSMPMPAGYCEPGAEFDAFAEQMAQSDSQNATLADVDRCGTYGEDYVLVKTPRTLPPIPFPREQFIALMAQQIDQGTALEDGMAQADEDIAAMSDGQMSVDTGSYAYAGYDDFCLYLAGDMILNVPGGSVDATVASCSTLIGTRNITVHVYNFKDNRPSANEMKVSALNIARSIEAR